MATNEVVTAASVAQKRGISQSAAFEAIINNQIAKLSKVAAAHISPTRLLGVAVAAASRNQLLFACEASTVISALCTAAELGLGVGAEQEAALVPFKNNKRGGVYECQLMPMYAGILKLVWQSELVTAIDFAVVYEGDHFEYKKGTDLVVDHRPNMDRELPERFWPAGENDEDPSPDRFSMIRCVYACATIKGGGKVAIVLTRTQVARYRNMSRAKDSAFWLQHWEAMAIKTAIRQLCKFLPKSTQLAKTLAVDNSIDTGEALGAIFDIPEANQTIEEEVDEQGPGMAGAKASLQAKAAAKDLKSAEGKAVERLTKVFGLTTPEVSDFQAWCAEKQIVWTERALDESITDKEGLYKEPSLI